MEPLLSLLQQSPACSSASASDARRAAAGETLVVVDDGSAGQAAALGALESLGYRVLRAADLQAGFEILQSGAHVDLLLADTAGHGALPSPELAQRLRQIKPGVALMITSACADDPAGHGELRASGVELLVSPYRPDELVRSVRHLLANQQQVNALATALREARRKKAEQESAHRTNSF